MNNPDEKRELVKIGELAEKVGLPIPTIRHYTKMGLLKVSAFTDGGQYLYEEDKAVEDLKYISELVGRGMKLHEIGEKVWGKNAAKKAIIIDDDVQVAELLKNMIKRFYPKWEIEVSTNVFDAGRENKKIENRDSDHLL